MKRSYRQWHFSFLAAVILMTGCVLSKQAEKILPAHDEVLIYALPYDLVYLRTLEALENVDGWELEETEKEKGLIVARNVSFGNLSDADKRLATFYVTRINRNETSVALAKKSVHVLGGDTLLERISEFVSREI